MIRRGNHEGTVVKRKDGRWEARLSLPASYGAPAHRASYYGKTQSDVRAKMRAAQRAREHGEFKTAASETVGAFLTRWLGLVDVEPSTREAYRQKIQLHVIPALGHLRLDRVDVDDIDRLLREKATATSSYSGRPLSHQSVQHIRTVLRTAFNYALKKRLIDRNPVVLSDAVHVEPYEPVILNAPQARAFLDSAVHERLSTVFDLLIALSLRVGEVLALTWDDVDLDTREVTVQHAIKRVRGKGLVLGKTKTTASRRSRSLPNFAAKALRTRRIRQNEERFAAGEHWQNLNLIITTTEGRPISPTYITNTVFRRVCRRAGIQFSTRQRSGLRLHDLRHSSATILGVAGHSESAIQKQLGHASSASTRRYRHVVDQEMVAMAATLDRLIGGRKR